jgi:hypothetical protein
MQLSRLYSSAALPMRADEHNACSAWSNSDCRTFGHL